MKEFQRNIAIVIGIDDYGHGISTLRTAVNDAGRLAEILRQEHGFEVWPLTNEDATRHKLQVLLKERLPQEIGANDRVLFYFAGHGIALDGDDGPTGYLIPQDAEQRKRKSFLPMQELHEALSALPCRHMLIILDCCFAGAFRWSSTRALSDVPEVIHQERYERFIRDPAWQVITSASYDEKALDLISGDIFGGRGEEGRQNSPFASALFDALYGAGDVYPPAAEGRDHTGDGIITATELHLYLSDRVSVNAEKAGNPQTPELWPLQKHDKGEYIFLVPGYDVKLPAAPELTVDNNPYRGLESFEEEHAALFFGREKLVGSLYDTVLVHPLTVVLGVSGTGKSSLVKAGLVPYVEQLNAQSSIPPNGQGQADFQKDQESSWYLLSETVIQDEVSGAQFEAAANASVTHRVLRPGESPIRALLQLLKTHQLISGKPKAQQRFWQESSAFAEAIDSWKSAHPKQRLLLVIDQFEEVITLCHREPERERFLGLLAEALHRHADRLRLVLTLRSDFEPQLSSSPLQAYWWTSSFHITKQALEQLARDNVSKNVLEHLSALGDQATLGEQQFLDRVRTATGEGSASRYKDPIVRRCFLTSARFLVPPMTQDELREAIEGPASVRVLYFEPHELVDRLINEVVQTPGALPLLSFTLSELYIKYLERRGGDRALIEKDYRALGGVIGSLRHRATEVYEHFDGAHQETMRRVMLRMLVIEGGEVTRRKLPKSELIYPDEDENDRVELVLHHLIETRLIVGGSFEDQDGRKQTYVEPAHDALVRAWDKLLNWREKEEETLVLQRRLTPEANEWKREQDEKKRKGLLWDDDPRLPLLEKILSGEDSAPPQYKQKRFKTIFSLQHLIAQSLRKLYNILWPWIEIPTHLTWLNNAETSFIQASIKQRRKNLRQLIGAVIAVMIALSILTIFANAQRKQAQEERAVAQREAKIAKARQLATQAQSINSRENPQLSLLLAIGAIITGDGLSIPAAEQAVWDEMLRASDFPLADIEGHLLTGHESANTAIAFSPDSQWLAAGNLNGVTRLWNLRSGAIADTPRTLQGHSFVSDMTFVSEGRWLALGRDDGMLRLWNLHADVASGGSVRDLWGHKDAISAMAVSPSGRWLITGSEDGTACLWDVKTSSVEKPMQILRGHKDAISVVTISQDERWLVTGSKDGTAGLWNLQKADLTAPEQVLQDHGRGVTAAAISPDGRWLVTGGWQRDNLLRLWDLKADNIPKSAQILPGHDNVISAIGISRDGRWLVTGSQDSTARLWDLQADEIQSSAQVLAGHRNTISAVSFSPDGHWLVTGSWDGTARLWDLWSDDVAASTRLLPEHGGEISAAMFSEDGRWLAAGSNDGTTRLWELQDRQAPASVQILSEPEGAISSVSSISFSPDERWLIGKGLNGPARLWDLQADHTAGSTQPLPYEMLTSPGPFDQRGRWLLTLDENNRSYLLDLQAKDVAASAQRLLDEDFSVEGLSADRRWLLTQSSRGPTRLWDLSADDVGRAAQILLPEGFVSNGKFSPDGHWLFTGLTVWNLRSDDISASGQRLQGSEYPVDFSPDGRWMLTASANDTVRFLVDLESDDLVASTQEFQGHTSSITEVAFSPKGRWLVTVGGNADGTRLWELHDHDVTGSVQVLEGPERGISVKTFSLDDLWLVTVSREDGRAWLWDLQADDMLSSVRVLGESQNWIHTLATFSPEGRWLVIAQNDHTARLWDLQADDIEGSVRVLWGHQDLIRTIAFSSKGRWLLTGSEDGTVRLWDLHSDDVEGSVRVLRGHKNAVTAVAMSSEGRWMASGTDDGSVWLWRLKMDELREWACHIAGRNLSFFEWNQYFRGEEYRLSCPKLPAHYSVLQAGRGLAKNRNIEAAVNIFRQVLNVDSGLDFDPQAEAGKWAASQIIEDAKNLALKGNIPEALTEYKKAAALTSAVDVDAESWAILCAVGSLWGYGFEIIDACEQGTALKPQDGKVLFFILLGRGIAKAQNSNYAESVKDLKMVADWLENYNEEQHEEWLKLFSNSLPDWIRVLQAGENPFTPEALGKLREGIF